MDPVADTLIAMLRRLQPTRVRVFDANDEARDVAVPTRRRKWTQVIAAIEARPWVRAELLDKAGAALGYVENGAPAGDLEELGGGVGGGRLGDCRWFLELMIKAQSTALTYRDKEHSALLGSMRDMLVAQGEATRELVAVMRMQRDEAMELAQLRAAAQQGDGLDEVIKLIEASPKLAQSIGPLLGLLIRPNPNRLPAATAPAAAPTAPATAAAAAKNGARGGG